MTAVKVQIHPFLTSTSHTGELSAARPRGFASTEIASDTHQIAGWVGLTAVAYITIFQPLPGNKPQFLGSPARSLRSVPTHAEHCDSVVKQILTVAFLIVISQNLSAVTDYTV
jgi:hypothetical protein